MPLLSETTELRLCEAEQLSDKVDIALDVNMEVSSAGGDPAVEVGGAITVYQRVTVLCLLARCFRRLLKCKKLLTYNEMFLPPLPPPQAVCKPC